MKFQYSLAAIASLLALAPSAASAASFVKYGDRTTFTSAAGSTRTESFNSITSDIDLATAHDFGDFTMQNQRVGPYGISTVDAAPFITAGGSLNGSTYVQSTVYDFTNGNMSSLVITFDEAITAFGANFTSGAIGNLYLYVDGELLQGSVANQGDFFGFTSDKAFSKIELRARAGSGFSYTFDDMTFSTAAVPEPATWGMMMIGFAVAGSAMRRRRIDVSFA